MRPKCDKKLKLQSLVDRWRAGEPVELPWEIRDRHFALVRITDAPHAYYSGYYMETSRNDTLSLESARDLVTHYGRIRAKGHDWKATPEDRIYIGVPPSKARKSSAWGYRLTRVKADGTTHLGCTAFEGEEIERLGRRIAELDMHQAAKAAGAAA